VNPDFWALFLAGCIGCWVGAVVTYLMNVRGFNRVESHYKRVEAELRAALGALGR
jgi:membrane protein YqaA with SNARE-associated domain